MTTNEELEALYGPAATHSEYSIGQTVCYHRTPGDVHQGEILYVCAPAPVLMRDGRTVNAPLSYVVDAGEGMPDIIYSNDIIPEAHPHIK